jgi:serine/threonine protein kinase
MNPAEVRTFDGSLPPSSPSELVIWAYDEYCRLRAQGQTPDLDVWCARFPACRSRVRRVIQAESDLGSLLDQFNLGGSDDESLKWPTVGARVFDFTILRQLAWGSFARVYLATEESAGDRLVVLKCSLCGDAEARTMGRLSHPHIVPILSARLDETSALTIVCMPYLGSTTLEDVLDLFVLECEKTRPKEASFLHEAIRFHAQPEDPPARRDPWLGERTYTDAIVRLAVQLAETLAFLHERGVCHRDLKPSNVLLDPSGKPLLLDFNLSDSERETAPIGATLRYAAPEQLRAFVNQHKGGMDGRTDLYALAVMLYELLGGVHPCAEDIAHTTGRPLANALLSKLSTGFRSFRTLAPDLERPVAAILDRCLAFDAADRPASAAEVAATLRLQFRFARRMRRYFADHRRSLAAIVAVCLIVFTLLGYIWSVAPSYSQREYERGRSAYRAADFDAAEQHFDRALRAEPSNARYRHARGCARLQQSKFSPKDKAKFNGIREDLFSTRQGPADPQTLAVQAYIDARNQNYQKAIKIYDMIQPSGYRPVMVLNNRAYCNMSKYLWDKAQPDLDRAVELDPRCQAVRFNRALVNFRLKTINRQKYISLQALGDIELALQLGPKNSEIYREAALIYAEGANDDLHELRQERALSFMLQALSAGEPSASFAKSPFLACALKRPEFAALIEAHPPQAAPQPELRLVDPVDWD